MPKPILNVTNENSTSRTRAVLRMAWNGSASATTKNTFRAINNAGDPLSRMNYSCGGPNPLQNMPGVKQNVSMFRGGIKSMCDTSNVPAASTNVKYVYDSSLFTRFKKETAVRRGYSDTSYGGDNSNATKTALSHIRG